MGGRGRRGFNAGKGGQWMEVTRDRFESKGTADKGKGKASMPEQIRGSVAARAAELGGGGSAASSSGVWARAPEEGDQEHLTGEPVAPVNIQSAHRAALEHHRMVTGRRASGFDPTRNTFYICGRPVQVLIQSKQDYGLVLQNICSLAIPLETNWFFQKIIIQLAINELLNQLCWNLEFGTGIGADTRAGLRGGDNSLSQGGVLSCAGALPFWPLRVGRATDQQGELCLLRLEGPSHPQQCNPLRNLYLNRVCP